MQKVYKDEKWNGGVSMCLFGCLCARDDDVNSSGESKEANMVAFYDFNFSIFMKIL